MYHLICKRTLRRAARDHGRTPRALLALLLLLATQGRPRSAPIVLIVFDDAAVESRFPGVARDLIDQTRVDVPMWVTHREAVEREGPMGEVWRAPDTLDPTSIFGRKVSE